MAWPRLDSLFARLLALQLLLALLLMLLFGVFVYVERNVAVARLVAERWAPGLRQAAGWMAPVQAAAPATRLPLQRGSPPETALRSPLAAPSMVALDDELRRQGVPVQQLLIASGEQGPMLWLEVGTPQGPPAWLGIADPALLPTLSPRLWQVMLLGGLLLTGLSWAFTRRLTRPLEQLRERMQQQRPGTPATDIAPVAPATRELAAIEAAYRDLLQRFERHERERSLLLAGVSHDLRSPLARIRLAAGLLPEQAEGGEWREAIIRNTQVADRLIGSFLDHVRAGELALDQSADLAALARGQVATHGAHGDQAIALDAPDTLLLQHTRALLLERLLDNLLDNAVKHGRPPVALRLAREGAQVLIEVSDAGPGLPPAQREALLQAFARGDSARGTPGTGLGLAIAARVVARMGGQLGFTHEQGRHRVRVTLPGPAAHS
jgi:two-component system, OmpR family, osmolarity sensor histidine kinase EnvZ